EPTGVGDVQLQGAPPLLRRALGAVGVRGPPCPDQLPGFRVPDDHLARLRRRVDPGDKSHQRAPIRCSTASWLSRTKPHPREATSSASYFSNAVSSASSCAVVSPAASVGVLSSSTLAAARASITSGSARYASA